jgi:hypothetical protein
VVKHSVGILEMAAKEGPRRYVSEKDKASKVRAIKAKRRFALEQQHDEQRSQRSSTRPRLAVANDNEKQISGESAQSTAEEPKSFYDRVCRCGFVFVLASS